MLVSHIAIQQQFSSNCKDDDHVRVIGPGIGKRGGWQWKIGESSSNSYSLSIESP